MILTHSALNTGTGEHGAEPIIVITYIIGFLIHFLVENRGKHRLQMFGGNVQS